MEVIHFLLRISVANLETTGGPFIRFSIELTHFTGNSASHGHTSGGMKAISPKL